MMTFLSYLGTIFFAGGVGFLVCGFFFAGKYYDVEAERDRLLVALWSAGTRLRAAGNAAAADEAFAVADKSKAVQA